MPLVVAPVFADLDVQIEVDPAVEHLFEIAAGLGADALDHVAALADHDGLLRRLIDQNRRKDPA